MLSIYDLYDLSAIFKNIRAFPEYESNNEVLLKTINVLESRLENHDMNQFRGALRSINSLDKEKYHFAYVDNVYVYFPAFLKEKHIYILLIECCECLLKAIEEKNTEKIADLADCLHNLPTLIADNSFSIPKNFWKNEMKYYRKKWDKNFLKQEGRSYG